MTLVCHVVLFIDGVCYIPLSCAWYHWPESLQTSSLMPAQWAEHRRPSELSFVTFYGMCCASEAFIWVYMFSFDQLRYYYICSIVTYMVF